MQSESANRDVARAWKYHNDTKHSTWSIGAHPHSLDWANLPLTLKIYTSIDPIPLPREPDQTGITALSAISQPAVKTDRVPNSTGRSNGTPFTLLFVKIPWTSGSPHGVRGGVQALEGAAFLESAGDWPARDTTDHESTIATASNVPSEVRDRMFIEISCCLN